VDPTNGLDVLGKRNLLLLLEIEPQLLDCPAPCPLTILTALYLCTAQELIGLCPGEIEYM
jgi:hypothetical protein